MEIFQPFRGKQYKPELSNVGNYNKIGEDCVIHSHVWIGDDVFIGNRCKIQAFAFIPNGVCISNDVFIGPHVCFTNDKNPPNGDFKQTMVEDDVAIGANATILPGVHIGRGAKIGAGAVVTKSVPAGEVWVGNPAKPLIK